MKRNILFDLDGTLTDPSQGISRCLQHSLRKMEALAPKKVDLHWCIGPPLLESLSKLLPNATEAELDCALTHYRERFSQVGLFENEVYPGIPELLRALSRENMDLFVASSKPEVFVRRILDHFELSPFFHASYGSLLDGTFAAKTDLIAHVLRKENLRAAETLMIGDRVHDVIGAKANGVETIGVSYGFGSETELVESGVDYLAGTPEEILAILRQLK